MQILDRNTVMVNPANGLIDEALDAHMDATDHAHRLGKADAMDGKRQDAFIFPAHSDAWKAYHAGYREGSILAAFLTGKVQRYWSPVEPTIIQSVSWNEQPTNGLYRCPVCKQYYDPTYGHQCGGGISESDFMHHTLDQLRNGSQELVVAFSDDVLASFEDEEIGAEIAARPWAW